MKSLKYIFSIICIISIVFLSGCEMLTKQQDKAKARPAGNDLVISEIFTLSPDKYYNYSWVELYNPTNYNVRMFRPSNPAAGLIIGANGTALYTSDDAETWTNIQLPDRFKKLSLNALGFATSIDGIIVCDSGIIIRVQRFYPDFTINPTPVTNPDPAKKTLHDVFMMLDVGSAGLAVGDSGIILRTGNRGKTWFIATGPGKRLRTNFNSCFITGIAGLYVIGDSGTILRQAGPNWEPKAPPSEFAKTNFYSIFAKPAAEIDTCIIVGANGAIIGSRNSGETWYPIASNVTTTLRHVFFIQGPQSINFTYKHGWIVGDKGVILRSTDWGATWIRKESGTEVRLNRVAFVEDPATQDLRGWVFGEGGTILSSSDGGETWTQKSNVPTTANLIGSNFIPVDNIDFKESYILEIRARRTEFYPRPDQINFINPPLTYVNYNIVNRRDTGLIYIDPQLLDSLPYYWAKPWNDFGFPAPRIPENLSPIFGRKSIDSLISGGFAVFNNDSTRFNNHLKLGPGSGRIYNMSIGYIRDATSPFGIRWFLWDLLPSSEIRLVKHILKKDGARILKDSTKIIDIVRWGDFISTVTDLHGQLTYPNNKPIGHIPEWYSISRYANDVGNADPNKLSTAESFYFAKDPIPRWSSQRRK